MRNELLLILWMLCMGIASTVLDQFTGDLKWPAYALGLVAGAVGMAILRLP